VSGPATRRPARARATPNRAANPAIAVTTHPLFDRLIHGRAWIGIVTFALIGIVTMQLGLLKLNAGIGRALEHEAALQRENSALSVENSEVAAGDTVELQAAHMGMQLVTSGSLRFLSAHGAGSEATTAARALAALNARASAASSTNSTSSEATSSESESSTTSASASEATTSTAGSEETSSQSESSSGTSQSSTSPSSESATSGESGASAAAAASAPSSESGGSSASPQG
jgi:hypothetical protein